MPSASHQQELMSRSCWRSIKPHRNRAHFSPFGTTVRAFRKSLCWLSFNPFSESTKTRKHREGMVLAWLSPPKRFACTAERYGPRILFRLGSKSSCNCQRHMRLLSKPMSCQNQSTAAPDDSRWPVFLGGGSVCGRKRRLANQATQEISDVGSKRVTFNRFSMRLGRFSNFSSVSF